jgi:hypothetical protein
MQDTFLHYLSYLTCGIIGLIFSTLLILRSLSQKAQYAKLQFKIRDYFYYDWYTPVLSLLSVILGLFMVDVTLKWNPALINWLKPAFAFLGYLGSDVVTRLFSAANRYLNKAIGDKTAEADSARGTTGTLTQAFPDKKTTPPPNTPSI